MYVKEQSGFLPKPAGMRAKQKDMFQVLIQGETNLTGVNFSYVAMLQVALILYDALHHTPPENPHFGDYFEFPNSIPHLLLIH